jgi:hypothetical protein
MGLFDLFRKSEWRKLKSFPLSVQQDISYLVTFDSLIKVAVSGGIRRLEEQQAVCSSSSYSRLCKALSDENMNHELHLALLSTGIGKEFSEISWSHLPPFRVVGFLGILAMCEYRNSEQLIAQSDLTNSGYSTRPDEARSQLLVFAAKQGGVENLEEARSFDSDIFLDFWLNIRKTIFADIQLNVAAEKTGLSLAIKERFENLSPSRKEIILILANTLSKNNNDLQPNQAERNISPASYNLSDNQRESPFKYVPYPKLVYAMQDISAKFDHFITNISIKEYELRRIIGARNDTANVLIKKIIELDVNTAAYCIVTAAVTMQEPDFAGCGVWKKLTESFENKNKSLIFVAAQALTSGMIGETHANRSADVSEKASLALNLIRDIRKSPKNYVMAKGNEMSRLSVLLAGTLVLKHVLNHPRFGIILGRFLIESLNSLNPILDEIKSGELLTWDQQKKLSV